MISLQYENCLFYGYVYSIEGDYAYLSVSHDVHSTSCVMSFSLHTWQDSSCLLTMKSLYEMIDLFNTAWNTL